MKQISFRWGYKIFLAILFTCIQVFLWAQDTNQTVTTKTTETTTQWYSMGMGSRRSSIYYYPRCSYAW